MIEMCTRKVGNIFEKKLIAIKIKSKISLLLLNTRLRVNQKDSNDCYC